MRLERLNYNKIKIYLTVDDLTDRGLTKEDIWKDSVKWHQLFHEMLEEASDTFGVDIQGPVAVEIFSLQAQGMVMIVTMEDEADSEDEEDALLPDGFYDMQITIDQTESTIYEFADLEDVIGLAKRLSGNDAIKCSLIAFQNKYYLCFPSAKMPEDDRVLTLATEFGNVSLFTIHYLQEYGRSVFMEYALKEMNRYFH